MPSGVHALITSSPKKANLANLQHSLPAEHMLISLLYFLSTPSIVHSLFWSMGGDLGEGLDIMGEGPDTTMRGGSDEVEVSVECSVKSAT